MATTTRSAAKKQEQPSSAPSAEEAQPGSKHKTQESPTSRSPKRSKKIDEGSAASDENGGKGVKEEEGMEEKQDQEKGLEEKRQNGSGKEKTEEGTNKSNSKETAASAVEPQGRDNDTEKVPASILEKGIIYFFFRSRVNVDSPSDVSDIARSHIILRPMEQDAKLGSGPIGDAGNSRLCLLPKKTLPQSGRDRFTAFVEKSSVSFQTLKDEFLASGDYQTKTAGARHTPAATPVGEGVYAITSTGRTSHLAYILTLPEELGEVQREIGLKEKGSFVVSTKNPEFPGPPNARFPKAPEYPKEIFEEFRSLRWVPTQPKHLDYVNTQFLLVGESSGVEKALAPQKEDQEEGKAEPAEEMEKLEDEDVQRMKELSKDDSGRIFADLQAKAGDYPKLKTTF